MSIPLVAACNALSAFLPMLRRSTLEKRQADCLGFRILNKLGHEEWTQDKMSSTFNLISLMLWSGFRYQHFVTCCRSRKHNSLRITLNRRNHAIGLKPMTRIESVVMSIGLFISKWQRNDYLDQLFISFKIW